METSTLKYAVHNLQLKQIMNRVLKWRKHFQPGFEGVQISAYTYEFIQLQALITMTLFQGHSDARKITVSIF